MAVDLVAVSGVIALVPHNLIIPLLHYSCTIDSNLIV